MNRFSIGSVGVTVPGEPGPGSTYAFAISSAPGGADTHGGSVSDPAGPAPEFPPPPP